jgi:methionyl-tRNA formyltransferase
VRVVFMGTPSFSLASLTLLHERHEVVAVYTRPDVARGRGRRVSSSPVKELAQELGLTVLQPETLRDPEQIQVFEDLHADLAAVAAYGLLLPVSIIDAPPLGCLNVHASLLPRWRGAAPIERAIMAGDERTGVSIMLMERGLDTGPFAVQHAVEVDDKNAEELAAELGRVGAGALSEAIDAQASGSVAWTRQDERAVTYAKKVTAADVMLASDLSVADAGRRVRASSRHAACRMTVDGRAITVLEARPSPRALPPGRADCVGGLTIGLADGALEITSLVPAGRSSMAAIAWARGARCADVARWGPA